MGGGREVNFIFQKCICYVNIKLHIQFSVLGQFIDETNPVDRVGGGGWIKVIIIPLCGPSDNIQNSVNEKH